MNTQPREIWLLLFPMELQFWDLGNIGPLAGKPVWKGKQIFLKKFDIDVFDIELDAETPEEVIAVVKAIAPTFGGINLEDIRAPDCFEIERKLEDILNIPVFHDDQHGTAMIAGVAITNALEITNRRFEDIKVVLQVLVQLHWPQHICLSNWV